MPADRTIPPRGVAHDQSRFPRLFDASKKVVAYWHTGPDEVTVVGYYDTVSAANTASASAAKANGARPRVLVNWAHGDISHINSGAISHPDAREDLPAWYDEDPAA